MKQNTYYYHKEIYSGIYLTTLEHFQLANFNEIKNDNPVRETCTNILHKLWENWPTAWIS